MNDNYMLDRLNNYNQRPVRVLERDLFYVKCEVTSIPKFHVMKNGDRIAHIVVRHIERGTYRHVKGRVYIPKNDFDLNWLFQSVKPGTRLQCHFIYRDGKYPYVAFVQPKRI